MKYFSLLFFLYYFNISVAQESTKIIFLNPSQALGSTGKEILPIYKLQSDSVFYFDKSHKIIVRADVDFEETAFAFLYFTGWKNSPLDKSTLLIISNYKSPNPTIYVDYNHNLDLSDDGPPVRLQEKDSVDVVLHNSENTEAKYPVVISYPAFKDSTYKEYLKNRWKTHPDSEFNQLTGVDNWLLINRYNYLFTNAVINGKKNKDRINGLEL